MNKNLKQPNQDSTPKPKYDLETIWPKISVVTPSYNQGKYLETTILSVINQNYPNLEYIIIDGGSIDNSVEIIKKYENYLTYWVTEKDNGQSSALNKGFSLATGDIICWINSDDYFDKCTFEVVADKFAKTDFCWLIGTCSFIDNNENVIWKTTPGPFEKKDILQFWGKVIGQPSVFWNLEKMQGQFQINETLFYSMDLDLWLRFSDKAKPVFVLDNLSFNRVHEDAKTSQKSISRYQEISSVLLKHNKKPDGTDFYSELFLLKELSLNFLQIDFNKLANQHKMLLNTHLFTKNYNVSLLLFYREWLKLLFGNFKEDLKFLFKITSTRFK